VLAGYDHAYRRFTAGQTDIIVAGATQRFDFLPSTPADTQPGRAGGTAAEDSSPPIYRGGPRDAVDDAGFVFLGIAADGVRWCRHIVVDSIHLRRLEIPLARWWSEAPQAPPSTPAETQNGRTSGDAGVENEATVPKDLAGPVMQPTARLLEELRPLCTEDAMVELRLTGEISRQRYHQLELSSIRRYGEAHAFAFSIDDSALAFLPGDESGAFEERLSPREELIALADEWIAAAQDEQEQKALLATKEELLAALWSTRTKI
jgi:hypothetical protein